jgi:tRNA-intron endonuclease
VEGAVAQVTREGARVEAGRGASQLHSRGYHGTPQPGGALQLSWAEAAYLAEVGRLAVADGPESLSLAQILERGQAHDERFETRYLVFRDLRERGYVVREEPPKAGVDFTVRERGATGKAPSKFWVLAASERGDLEPASVHAWTDRAQALDKVPLVAVVDEEGDITYYKFQTGLEGPPPTSPGSLEPLDGALVGDHVLVEGPGIQALHGAPWHFGKPLKHLLRLSLLEAVWLTQTGVLTARGGSTDGEAVGTEELRALAVANQPDFDVRLAAYTALRNNRLVPKTGFKYGVHFRVYASSESRAHARFLVHAIDEKKPVPWPELSRAVRLSHGVRKHLVFALVTDKQRVRFLRARWTRP